MKNLEAAPIAEFSITKTDVPINVPFAISLETLQTASLAFVSLKDSVGRSGLGECAPFPTLTFDTLERAASAAQTLAASLIGLGVDEALLQLAQLRPEFLRHSITALAGVETALWDLKARQLGVPLAALFGNAGLTTVETDITLPLMPPARVKDFWRMFAGHGFKIVKIKVSGRVQHDLELVMAMLAELPPGAAFTLDGNQGFDLGGAKDLLKSLAARDRRPLFFEQPLPEDDWQGLADLGASTDVPICVDETVRTVADAERVVRDKTARIINLKVMKSGLGIVRRIAAVARQGGVELMIGGMLESEVTMTASLHFACGAGVVRHFDLDTPFFLTRRVTEASPWHRNSARLELPNGPGLGLTFNGNGSSPG